MKSKNLIVHEQTISGFNTSFTNLNSGRTLGVNQVIDQIDKGNPTYDNYHVVNGPTGKYIRSNPDKNDKNNIER